MRNTQCNMIIQYIKDFGSITQKEAVEEFGCYRLAARIADLKKLGYMFKKEMKTSINRYGVKVSYAKYSLIGEEDL